MTTIKNFLTAEISNAYNRGFAAGYDKARDELEACINEIVTNRSTPVAARRDAPPEAPAATPPRRKRRGLSPAEARIVDFVAANPGCTMDDISAAGISGRGTVYKLVALRKLRRTEDPKPHTGNRPWVHFYPMEPRNG